MTAANSTISSEVSLSPRDGEDKGNYAKRCIDTMRQKHIKGSVTVHIDDKGNVPKVSVNTVH